MIVAKRQLLPIPPISSHSVGVLFEQLFRCVGVLCMASNEYPDKPDHTSGRRGHFRAYSWYRHNVRGKLMRGGRFRFLSLPRSSHPGRPLPAAGPAISGSQIPSDLVCSVLIHPQQP
jgi:hypothetical protein